MVFVNNQTWIFGGFTQGSLMNDLFVLDMEGVRWIKAGVVGETPSPRENQVGLSLGQKMFVIGGCDYSKNLCYNEVWEFDIKFMRWSMIDKDYDNLIARGMAAINGDVIYFYGACLLNIRCETNMLVFNTTLGCPTNCSGHGACIDSKCRCQNSYFGKSALTRQRMLETNEVLQALQCTVVLHILGRVSMLSRLQRRRLQYSSQMPQQLHLAQPRHLQRRRYLLLYKALEVSDY